ncbi:PepSY-associated TM helix domain-containing protein [Nostoc sp.]|uniref:PepSY-associated TM helix domain-containing protein n=1 Tax=Nostoc sp. TaxID=1180 RepID=UPI002FF684AB
MTFKTLRNFVFALHRYIGLSVGLIAIIVGLTGSLLVFRSEIYDFQLHSHIGAIIPQGEPLPIEKILNAVKPVYVNQPDAILQMVYAPTKPDAPFNVVYSTKANDWIENYVHPYTGAVLGNNLKPNAVQHFFMIVYDLHETLLAGDIGTKILGIVGLLMCILTITGVILWPGWRKLIAGFKIKWNAHPKRVNFDIHKVVGIVAVVFLLFTFFTGFCWNLSELSEPLIRAVTLSPQKVEPMSKVVYGKTPLDIAAQFKTAQAALYGDATLGRIYFTAKPEDALRFRFKLPQEKLVSEQSNVYLDQYSGKVLRVDNGLKLPLGDRILNSFPPLHFGTFGGLPTRILYVFVGLVPLILFVTGFVMWRYRYRANPSNLNHPMELSKKR